MAVYDSSDFGLGRSGTRGYVVSEDNRRPVPGGQAFFPRGGGSAAPASAPPTKYTPVAPPPRNNDQVSQLQTNIVRLQQEKAALIKTIQTYNKPPEPGRPPTGLQAAFQKLIKQVRDLQARARAGGGGGASAQQLQALREQVGRLQAGNAGLTRTIQTYNQPPAAGQQPTGLQAAFQQLIRKVQTREAALRARGIPIPNP